MTLLSYLYEVFRHAPPPSTIFPYSLSLPFRPLDFRVHQFEFSHGKKTDEKVVLFPLGKKNVTDKTKLGESLHAQTNSYQLICFALFGRLVISISYTYLSPVGRPTRETIHPFTKALARWKPSVCRRGYAKCILRFQSAYSHARYQPGALLPSVKALRSQRELRLQTQSHPPLGDSCQDLWSLFLVFRSH